MSDHNEEDFQRIEYPGDPDRCQFVMKNGQCNLKAMPGKSFCTNHGGAPTSKEATKNFYKTKWKAEIQRKVQENQDIYDLTEEIGILRLTLEALLSRCSDDIELVMAAGPMGDLIMKINNVVGSFHKLRIANGNLLDKSAVLRFVAVVIDILTEHFGDQPEKLELVAKKIIGATDGENLSPSGAYDSSRLIDDH